jgi:hypothetical protein
MSVALAFATLIACAALIALYDCHMAENTAEMGKAAVALGESWHAMSDVHDFSKLAHFCTDKVTTHQYQWLYANVLAPYRHPPPEVVDAFVQQKPGKRKKPFKLLEIGLGCNMDGCVAGGFRLLRNYLPLVEYYSFEYQYDLCKSRFNSSNITAEEEEYLDAHLCRGSSDSKIDIDRCGERFGPFDIVIDDGSHLQTHVVAGLQMWVPSPHLKPGGAYIIEDLQAGYWHHYQGGKRAQVLGNTGPELIKDILDAKLASDPHTGKVFGNTEFSRSRRKISLQRMELATMITLTVCSGECCAFVKKM